MVKSRITQTRSSPPYDPDEATAIAQVHEVKKHEQRFGDRDSQGDGAVRGGVILLSAFSYQSS